jgi:hypothetical protein
VLKPQDILVCLHLSFGAESGYARIAESLHMPLSTAHRAVQRAAAAKLIDTNAQVIRANLLELLVHGVRYVFYPELGSSSRGVPTGATAPGLRDRVTASTENSPVWPHPKGRARGHILAPLHPSVPDIALMNENLYTALAAVDLIRIGTARERAVAAEVLQELLPSR